MWATKYLSHFCGFRPAAPCSFLWAARGTPHVSFCLKNLLCFLWPAGDGYFILVFWKNPLFGLHFLEFLFSGYIIPGGQVSPELEDVAVLSSARHGRSWVRGVSFLGVLLRCSVLAGPAVIRLLCASPRTCASVH